VLVQRGEFEEAAQQMTKALELGSGDAITYGLLGYCYMSLDKYASAESAYRRATLLNPDNTDWQLGLARTLLAQQKTKEAAALLDELIQEDPEKPDYWFHQANAYLELGETRKAANNYEIVRRMGKATGASLMALGDIYMSEDLRDLALDAYLESMSKQPDQDIKRPLRSAEIMASRQEWDKTATILGKIKDYYRTKLAEADRLRILKLESKIALAHGQEAQAVATIEQIIEKDPLDGEAILILANHYANAGDFDRAELLFDRAEKLKDHEVAALTQHAQALVARSKYDKAAKLLQRAQSLRPREAVAKYLEQVERLAKASGT
jgi:Flp pilus assembly protein TadD